MAARKKTKTKAKKGKKVKKKSAVRKKGRKAVARKPAPKKAAAKKKTKKTKTKTKTKAKAKARAKAKGKAAKAPKAVAPRAAAPAPAPVEPPAGERIGVVTHYYNHLSVAVVQLETGTLRVGEMVRIKGHTTDFTQPVESMEVDHMHVNEVAAGQSFGLRVKEHAREHDVVYKVVQ